MAEIRKVDKKNLRTLAWKRGFRGVVGLAKKMKVSRVSLHRAVNQPNTFKPLYRRIEKILKPNEP